MRRMKYLAFLFALAAISLPAAAQSPCDNGLCGASGLSSQALSEAARADTPKSSPMREELRSPERPRDPWNRYMPTRPDLESYDCILSAGIGGELGKGGFFGTRVLGQTQAWRDPSKNTGR